MAAASLRLSFASDVRDEFYVNAGPDLAAQAVLLLEFLLARGRPGGQLSPPAPPSP